MVSSNKIRNGNKSCKRLGRLYPFCQKSLKNTALTLLIQITPIHTNYTVEESGASDTEDSAWSLEEEWLVGQAAPLNLVAQCCGANTLHLALGDLVLALLQSGKFTVSMGLLCDMDMGHFLMHFIVFSSLLSQQKIIPRSNKRHDLIISNYFLYIALICLNEAKFAKY